jgi:hypothetical protein
MMDVEAFGQTHRSWNPEGANSGHLAQAWCEKQKIRPPSKRAVAQRLLERDGAREVPLVSAKGAEDLRVLIKRISNLFGIGATLEPDAATHVD